MEESDKRYSCWQCECNTKGGNIGWGLFLLVLGGYFIIQDLGYLSSSVSFWSVVIVALGAYLLSKGLK